MNRRRLFPLTIFGLGLGYLLVSSFFVGDTPGGHGDLTDGIHRFDGLTMGTSYQLQIVEIPAQLSAEIIATEMRDLLLELDRGIFSTYAADSELSRFNRHAVNEPFAASSELLEVLSLAQQIAVDSSGAFDITVGPLVNLWGFGPDIRPGPDALPTQDEIDVLLQSIGYQYFAIDSSNSQISKSKEITVDLSGIAKGYAVDKIAEYLDQAGVKSYFLEIGGELKMKGLKPGGESWVPAIEAPLDTASQVYEIFFSHGEQIAVAGSGDYRNYYERDGVRYSHEIDPRSGRPISHKLAAAYVIDASAARADALATAYMILGLEDAKALAASQGQAAYFIYQQADAKFEDFVTDEFKHYLLGDNAPSE